MTSNTRITSLTAAALVTFIAGTPAAMAQYDREQDRNQNQQAEQKQARTERSEALHFMLSEDLIGSNIVGLAGETAGSVKDIIVRAKDGKVKYAIVSAGGVLGIGDKVIAVPMSQIRWDARSDNLVLSMREETLRNMPAFDAGKWTNLKRENWEKALSDHDEKWQKEHPEDHGKMKHEDSDKKDDSTKKDQDRQNRDRDTDRNQPGYGADKDMHGGMTLIRISDVSGTNVRAGAGASGDGSRDVTLEDSEKVGEIDGAVIEMTTRQAPFVIVSTGGVLGFGEDDRLVPWQAMKMAGDKLVLTGIEAETFKSLESVSKRDIDGFDSPDDIEHFFDDFDVDFDMFDDDMGDG